MASHFISEKFEEIRKLTGKNDKNYHYNWSNPLGSGTFGRVYKGWKENETKGEYFAIKEVLIPQNQNKALVEKICEQEIKELERVKQEKSPHIVKLFEVIRTNTTVYMVMEYCDGRDLRYYLQDKKDLNTDEIIFLFHQILEGMKVLRRLNRIHRDIKTENILVNDGILKISDFQFAREEYGATTTGIGTPYFMAPEMNTNNPNNCQKVDIFSLGVLLYWLITRTIPWLQNIKDQGKGVTQYTVSQEITKQLDCNPPKLWFPDDIVIDENLKSMLFKMLKFNEGERVSWEDLFSKFDELRKKIKVSNVRSNLQSSKGIGEISTINTRIDNTFLSEDLVNPIPVPIDITRKIKGKEDENKSLNKILSRIELHSYTYIFLYNVILRIIELRKNINLAKNDYYQLLLHLGNIAFIFSYNLEKTFSGAENDFGFPNEEWGAFVKCLHPSEPKDNIRMNKLKEKIKSDNSACKKNIEQILKTADEEIDIHLSLSKFKSERPRLTKAMLTDFNNCLRKTLKNLKEKLDSINLPLTNESTDFKMLLLIEDLSMVATLKSTFDWPETGDFNLASFYEMRQNFDKRFILDRVKTNFQELLKEIKN